MQRVTHRELLRFITSAGSAGLPPNVLEAALAIACADFVEKFSGTLLEKTITEPLEKAMATQFTGRSALRRYLTHVGQQQQPLTTSANGT